MAANNFSALDYLCIVELSQAELAVPPLAIVTPVFDAIGIHGIVWIKYIRDRPLSQPSSLPRQLGQSNGRYVPSGEMGIGPLVSLIAQRINPVALASCPDGPCQNDEVDCSPLPRIAKHRALLDCVLMSL